MRTFKAFTKREKYQKKLMNTVITFVFFKYALINYGIIRTNKFTQSKEKGIRLNNNYQCRQQRKVIKKKR